MCIYWMINHPWPLAVVISRVLTMADANPMMNTELNRKEKLQKTESGGVGEVAS